MTKPVITTRASKGSALNFDELDANFTNLDDATITLKAGTGGTNVVTDLNGTITVVAGNNITIAGDNTAKTLTINASAGFDEHLVYTYQNLDGGTPEATLSSDVNLLLIGQSAGNHSQTGGDTGSVGFGAIEIGAGISLETSGNISLATTGNIVLDSRNPSGGGNVILDNQKFPVALGGVGQVLVTDTVSGSLSTLAWTSLNSLTNNGVNLTYTYSGGKGTITAQTGIELITTSNGNISLVPNGSGNIQLTPASGKVTISAVDFPTGDGTNGQTLVTNGSGQLSWGPGGLAPSTSTANRDTAGGYTDSTRPGGYTVFNTDTKTLQYWGEWSAYSGTDWNDIGNKRSVRPSSQNTAIVNADISGGWVFKDLFTFGISYTTYTASLNGKIQLPDQGTQAGRKYTLLINKSSAAVVGFGVQGVMTSGEQILSGETGTFIYDIEYLGFSSWRVTRL